VQKEADKLSQQLLEMTDDRAAAAHILEYDGDRRKRALAESVLSAFKAGANSSAHAEHIARASDAYGAAITQLGREYAAAEQTRKRAEGIQIRLDVLRSIMSNERKALDL
jgi:hypothetical protein